jgi:hypothetical protein
MSGRCAAARVARRRRGRCRGGVNGERRTVREGRVKDKGGSVLERDGGTRVRRDGGAVGSARERRRRDARYIAWRRRDDEGVAVSVSAVHAMRARVAACMYHTRAIIHKSGDVAVDRFVTTEDTSADGGGAIVSVACVAALAVYTMRCMSEAVVRMRDTSRTMAREDGTTGAKQYR